MMQFRMITILLIVFLSLGFNVAHSELKPIHSPCINSTNCESGCCYRFHTKRAGICAPSCYTACFGPNVGERCFYSSECNSGCCHGEDLMTDARCKHKRSEDQKCFGPMEIYVIEVDIVTVGVAEQKPLRLHQVHVLQKQKKISTVTLWKLMGSMRTARVRMDFFV
ncbi:uncharacterized protein [Eleutherodactylus coqui]|uniref:uncharacterized protein isoform X2 n=1 Tax=Eleutherodactylus coqui TaxID=57060 RepID=UPI003461978F